MKKRILIVTYHDGINYGAFLQVYSLQEFLIKNNFEVSILNYKSYKHTILEYFYLLKTKNISFFIKTLFKIIKFKKLQNKALNLTKRFFKIPHNLNSDFDFFIYGSDEIWNYNNDLIGLDTVYFGDKIKGKKISYAPSFGNIDSNNILPKKIINLLKNFIISVRDINSYEIISKNIGIQAEIVLDPTFLITNHLCEYTSMINYKEKYILIYMTQQITTDRWQELLNYANIRKLKLISVGYNHKLADINFINTDPVDFMYLIINAEIIITNMFHGFILSLQNSKNVHLFFDEYRKNKLGFYLDFFNLKYLVISDDESLEENFLNKNVDYHLFNLNLENKLAVSKNYLLNNLS